MNKSTTAIISITLISIFALPGCSLFSRGGKSHNTPNYAEMPPLPQPDPAVLTPKVVQESEYRAPADYDANCRLSFSSPETLDSLTAQWYERNVVTSHDDFFDKFIMIDADAEYVGDVPDSVYRNRMRMLVSPISLGFNNIIKSYIISWTTRNKSLVGRILGLAHVYFPMIEEELSNQGLPLELRMLPVIESALNPVAVSRAGATGLWQFMYATGKSYGLDVTSFVDERRDPVLATKAACRYLGDLYKMYGDWTLAIAAYNCGPGNVNKALKRAGDDASTFWDIYPYLPRETRGYVPSFVAANYAYAFHKQHGIEMVAPPLPIGTDTVMVNKLTHFEQISSTLDIPVEIIRSLNPQYKEDIIPAVDKGYPLKLPQYDISRYIANEPEIMAKDTVYLAKYINQPAENLKKEVAAAATRYTVKKGDTLGGIARKHGVSVNQIVKWNNLKNANAIIRPGQRLEIRK